MSVTWQFLSQCDPSRLGSQTQPHREIWIYLLQRSFTAKNPNNIIIHVQKCEPSLYLIIIVIIIIIINICIDTRDTTCLLCKQTNIWPIGFKIFLHKSSRVLHLQQIPRVSWPNANEPDVLWIKSGHGPWRSPKLGRLGPGEWYSQSLGPRRTGSITRWPSITIVYCKSATHPTSTLLSA